MRMGGLIAGVLFFLLAGTPAADAQQARVFVDPNSPTGSEYDIPLERARREASPSAEGAQPSRSAASALFGEGISAPPAQTSGSAARSSRGQSANGTGRGGSAKGTSGGRRGEVRSGRTVPAVVESAIKRPGAPAGGAGSLALLAAAGLAVALLGMGTGLLLRRTRNDGQ